MAADFTLPIREAVVAFLRLQGSFTALQPPARIYGLEQPPNTDYPFTRFGTPSAVPLDYSCASGETMTADIHVFAESEAECSVIAAELVTVLDEAALDLANGASANARWTGGPGPFEDSEVVGLWHAVRTFDFEAME